MVYNFCDKKIDLLVRLKTLAIPDKYSSNANKGTRISCGAGFGNKKQAKKLHKPIIREFEKQKVHLPFIDNIRGADLTYMQLLTKSNKGIRFSLYVINIFSKYACIVPFKEKKGITIK